MAQLCLCTKIRTKQWLVLGALGFQCMRWDFLCPQMRQFCLFTYPPRSKCASSENMIFFCQNRHLLPKAHLAKRKGIEWSIGFNFWINWTLYGIITRSLCKIRLNDVSEKFSCWERRWVDVDGASHTLSATAAILSGVRTVFAIDEDASFFHFLHKITNIRS